MSKKLRKKLFNKALQKKALDPAGMDIKNIEVGEFKTVDEIFEEVLYDLLAQYESEGK